MIRTKSFSNNVLITIIVFVINFYFTLSLSCQDNNCKTCRSYDSSKSCTECNAEYYISLVNDCLECPSNCGKCKLVTSNPDRMTKSTQVFCEICKNGYYLNSKNIITNY